MVPFHLRPLCLIFSVLMALSVGSLGSRANSALSAHEVVQKAVEHANPGAGRPSQTAYSYTKTSITEQIDSAGKIKDHTERVYQVSFRAGATWAKLLEVNGHSPAAPDMKRQTENDSNARQVLGQSKAGHIENWENFLTPNLVARFDFKLLGQTNLNGRTAYHLDFQPKSPEVPVRKIMDRLLNRLSGAIWIDAAEFEVARAEIRLGSEVDLLWGVVGCLKKFDYLLTRTRVADGVWLNSFSLGDFEGRKLFDPLRVKMKTQSSSFRPG